MLDRVFIISGTNAIAQQFLVSVRDYPPSQTAGSFNLDSMQKRIEAMGKMEQ
jgi:arylsulfatase